MKHVSWPVHGPRASSPAALHLALAATFVGALALYAGGTAPGLLYSDSGELQSVALLGGITHPSGYPTFVLFGRLFAHLPFAEPAFRINFMSACFGALAVALVLKVLVRLGASLLAAFAGAALYGLSYTFWTASLRAEVYTLAFCFFLLAIDRGVVALRDGRLGAACLSGVLLGVTLTVHLMFAFPIAALGLALAGRLWRGRPVDLARGVALLASFLVGLAPYAYVFWADHQRFEMNYFEQVRQAYAPLGNPLPGFGTTAERVRWLVFGLDRMPPTPFRPYLGGIAHGLASSATVLLWFQFGPLAGPLGFLGLRRQWRRERGVTGVLVAMALLSSVFAGSLVSGPLLFIFLMPATLLLGFGIALGLEELSDALAARAGPVTGRIALVVAPFALALMAQVIRLHAYDHPVGPTRIRVEDEGKQARRSLVPSMRANDEARQFGARAVAVIPESALVVSTWGELTVMYYEQRVKGLRRDLTIRPWHYPPLLQRLAEWQRTHDLARRPVVFLGDRPEWRLYATAIDSVPVVADEKIYVVRAPFRNLPPIDTPAGSRSRD